MKKLKSSLAAKAAAIFLLVAMLAVAAGAVVGTVALAGYDSYLDNGDRIREGFLHTVVSNASVDLQTLLSALAQKKGGEGEETLVAYYGEKYSPENSNLCIRVTDTDGQELFSNREYTGILPETEQVREFSFVTDERYSTRTKTFGSVDQVYEYLNFASDCYLRDYSEEGGKVVAEFTVVTTESAVVTLHIAVDATMQAQDDCTRALNFADRLIGLRDFLLPIAITALCLAAALFVFLLCAAGHKAGVEGIHLNWVDRIPFDLYLAILVGLFCGSVAFWDAFSYHSTVRLILAAALGLVWAFLWLSPVLSFAARIKAGSWWRNTVIFYVLRFLWRALCKIGRGIRYVCLHLPLVWRTVLVSAGITVLELFFLASAYLALPFWFVEKLLLIPLVLLAAINLRRLQKGGEAIAEGDMTYRVNTRHLLPAFRRHGENLNSIGTGMQKAVEVQMRSERMKAELITNVSHDIKTPLTSIVNYVDLLKTAGLDSPQAPEYLEVLDRQSARLKKLTEDLIEASKASTGNITVHAERTDVNVLVAQAAGEYEEKFKARALEPVLDFRVQEPCVWADGRLLWRVLDNLMSNICKYSLEHTRVYVQTQAQDGCLTVTFKNISREPLNVSASELMERFVRGDASRNTEGSGLGLSIARSLTELMDGSFELAIDGDLFKAQISFPLMND